MKKLFCLIFAVLFCLPGTFQISAFENQNFTVVNRNSITGFVFSDTRQPVADIYVELLSDLGTTLSRTKTSGAGLYFFRGIPDGRFEVKVLPYNTNYIEQIRTVSLFSFSAVPGRGAVNEQIDFYLQAKKDERAGQLAAPGVVFGQEVPQDAENLYKEGIEYLDKKKEKEAFESLKKALEIFPDYYLALDRLGTEYVMRGFYEPAYVLLSKAVDVNPKSFSSNFGLGLTYYRLQEIDKAIEQLQKSVELSDDSPNGHLWLGIAYFQKGELSKAETSLLKANKLSGEKSPEVHWQLAKLYNEQKKFRQSADELELFLKYNKKAKDADKIKQTIAVLRKKENSK